jgi:4'-phosphopantetheinyl transferase EntD
MIGLLVPPGVIAIEAYRDEWVMELLPEEQLLVARAVEKRRREFAAARNCARRGLADLGWPDFPVLWGSRREPLWPPGVLGSITHCSDYCAAAVARDTDVGGILGIGIDAEPNARLSARVVERILTSTERRTLADTPGMNVPALAFSAKESVYKAWFPIAARWLGYEDAEVDFDFASGRFGVRLLPSALVQGLPMGLTFTGRFGTTATHVFTLVTAQLA